MFFLLSFDNAFQISANVHEYSKTLSSALVPQATLLVFYLSASTTKKSKPSEDEEQKNALVVTQVVRSKK